MLLMGKVNLNLWIGALVLLIVIGIAGWRFFSSPQPAQALDSFARCLRDNGVTMYGANSCSHCAAQKKLFGDSFRYVPYVECPDNPQVCLSKGVDGYPTWIFKDGQRVAGETELQKISEITGCQLPQ